MDSDLSLYESGKGKKEANVKDRIEIEKNERWGDTAREVEGEWCCFLKAEIASQNVNVQEQA